MKKIGGIVAIVAGAAGLVFVAAGIFTSLIVAVFAGGNAGIAIVLFGTVGFGLCIAVMVLGAKAVKNSEVVTGRERLHGLLLILCAVAGSAFYFWLPFVLLMAQVVVGAIFLLLEKETPQDG